MYYVCVSFLYVTLLETLVKGPRSNRVSRYYLILNALHRLNAHAINCTSTADTLKKMSFFFVLYVSLVQRRILYKFMRCLPVISFSSNILFFSFFFIGKIFFVCDGDSGDSTKTTYTCPPAVTYMYVYINSHIYIWYFDFWYNVYAGSHRQVYASPLKPTYEKLYRKMSSVFHILQENLRILILNRYTNCKLFKLWLDDSCKSVLRHERIESPCLCFIIFWSLYVIQCLQSVLECAKKKKTMSRTQNEG